MTKKQPEPYGIGDVVTFLPRGLPIQAQGRIMSLYKNEENEAMMTVAMLQRPEEPSDYVKKNMKIYEYYETDCYNDIKESTVLKVVAAEVYPENFNDLEFITMNTPSKVLKRGFIYISGFVTADHQILPPTPMNETIWAFHFHPNNKVLASSDDVSNAYYSVMKSHLFDPFVHPTSRTSRHKNKNPNLWQLLVKLAPDVRTYEDFLPHCVDHPIAKAHKNAATISDWNLLDIEKMLAPKFTIPIILRRLAQIHELYSSSEQFCLSAPEANKLFAVWDAEIEAVLDRLNKNDPSLVDIEVKQEEKLAGSKHQLEETEEDAAFIKKVSDDDDESMVSHTPSAAEGSVTKEPSLHSDDEEETEDDDDDEKTQEFDSEDLPDDTSDEEDDDDDDDDDE
jgi:hypothetical protein